MEAITPSTHYIAARVKWLTVALAPLLTALMVWAAMEVVKNYLSGKGDPNIWVTGFVLTLLGSLALVFLASIPWAFRARVLLTYNRMTVRGLIRTRAITVGQIEGFRLINGQLHLYLKDRQWPVQLSHYEDQLLINAWVFRHAKDLGEQELVEEDVAISRDLALGMTEAHKEARLCRLRKIMKGINLLAYCGAVIGVLNVLFLEQDMVAKVAVAVLVSIPILLDLLALRNRGHIRIDYEEGTRYPQIFSGTMVCGVGVLLVSLFDRSTLIGDEFYQWFVLAAVAKGLLWLFIDLDHIRTLHARGWFASTITVISLTLLPAFWVGGSIYQINHHLDRSPVTWHSTEVIDKKVSKGKTISYSIKVAPWTPSLDEPLELAVRRKQFKQIEVGMPIEIGVRQGALQIPWVAEIKPSLHKSSSASVKAEAVIGGLYPPMPTGYRQESVGVFPDEDPESGRVHTLSWVSGPNGDWLWLSRRVDVEGEYSKWRLVASMTIPPFKRDRALIFLLCLIDDNPDPEVVAVVDDKPGLQTFTVVHDAWRANRRTQRFEKIGPHGVSCINESYGV